MNHLCRSKLIRWFAAFIAVLIAVFSFSGCSSDEVIDTTLSVLDAVLSDSEESASSEQFAPSESANAPPQSSEEPSSIDDGTINRSEPSSLVSSESSPPPSSSSEAVPTVSKAPESSSESSSSKEIEEDSSEDPAIDEDGWYSTKDEVALYLHTFGKLPGNYLTKKEASALGWDSKKGNLWDVAEGMSIGGDTFGNREGLLPSAKGRKWFECDINYEGGFRGAERILFSSDGLIFYTDDHYQSYTQLY